MSRQRISRARIKAAIEGSGGVISTIAKRAGYSWLRTRDFIYSDSELMALLQAEEETVCDMAESVIVQRIKEGDEALARWWLARRRRTKFGENFDVTTGGRPIVINVQWSVYGNGSENN